MKKFILNSLMAVLVFGGTVTYAETNTTTETNRIVCAKDTRRCPDGSFVSRAGFRCEFTKCPNLKKPNQGLLQKVREVFETRLKNKVEKVDVKNKIEERIASSTEKKQPLEASSGRMTNLKREEVKDKVEARVASSTTNKIERQFEKMTKKYLSTIEREKAIMGKIVSRIEKIKSVGGNTVEAERLVAEAKIKLDEARASYETLKTVAISADTFEKITKETLVDMRDATKAIEKQLRGAHNLLQKTVGSMRGVSQLRNATSTKEV